MNYENFCLRANALRQTRRLSTNAGRMRTVTGVHSSIATLFLAGVCACPPATLGDDFLALPGRWLFDQGMNYGLSVASPTVDDAEYILVWLSAATAVSPELCEAYLWQYDLFNRLDRHDEALAALELYCRRQPQDVSASLTLLDLLCENAATAEDRIELCRLWLKRPGLANEVASDLHRRLGYLAHERGETDAALAEARKAVAASPWSVPAAALLATLQQQENDPATQIDLLLKTIAAGPGATEALWRLGQALAEQGMFAHALEWYLEAEDAYQRAGDVPLALQFDVARAAFDAEKFETCFARCETILAQQPLQFDVHLLQIESARQLGRAEVVEQRIAALRALLDEAEPKAIEQRDGAACAQIAWFAAELDADPQRALRLAQQACDFLPHSPKAKVVLGFAQLAGGDLESAAATLEPFADANVLASVGFARALEQRGDKPRALTVLRHAVTLAPTGVPRLRLNSMLNELGAEPATTQPHNAIQDLLAGFDRSALRFDERADEILEFDVQIDRTAIELGQPVFARIRIANKGSFPISLGNDAMLDPAVAVSIRDTARNGHAYDGYLTIPLYGARVLAPGGELVAQHRLDVGLAEFILGHQPQRRFDAEFEFVLAPKSGANGAIVSALPAIQPVKRRLIRAPVDATPAGIARLAQRLSSGPEADRIDAVQTLAALLVEREIALHEEATYAAVKIDVEQLQNLLLSAQRDDTPLVRARALFALRDLEMTDAMVSAAAPLITDENWLVRLIAVEVFAKRHGLKFRPVLEQRSDDGNARVARLAQLYLSRLPPTKIPRSRPAQNE